MHTNSLIWQADSVSIQAMSPLEAGFPKQLTSRGGGRSLVLIEAEGLY